MRPQPPTNFRRLIRHRCQYCGRDFFANKQTGRPRLFCDKKCRDGEFRRLRYLTFKNVEIPQKSDVGSKISKVDSGDRPSVLIGPNDPPVNILGGYCWSNSGAVDRETLAEIIETEIGGDRCYSAVTTLVVHGPVRQRIVDLIANRPDGVTRSEILTTVYADDIDGGPDCENTISVLIHHANRELKEQGFRILPAWRGRGARYRLVRVAP